MNFIKKICLILLVLGFSVSVSYAAPVSSANGELDLSAATESGSGGPIIGLSPKVAAYYLSNGNTVTSSQWYAMSTGHPGGNKVYATAQDVNNIYSKEYSTAAAMSTYLQSIPTVGQSASAWTDEDWEL